MAEIASDGGVATGKWSADCEMSVTSYIDGGKNEAHSWSCFSDRSGLDSACMLIVLSNVLYTT